MTSPRARPVAAMNNANAKNNYCDSKCSVCNVIINEMLAFIADKVDILHDKALLQICTSAYTFEEIEDARHIAMSLLAPHKRVTRRKEGSEEKSLLEIIKLIKESEPASLPIFVAKTLKKLPAITFDHVDVTAFLKEMAVIKSELAILKSKNCTTQHCSTDIDGLKTDIEEIKQHLLNSSSSKDTSKPHSSTPKEHLNLSNSKKGNKRRKQRTNAHSTADNTVVHVPSSPRLPREKPVDSELSPTSQRSGALTRTCNIADGGSAPPAFSYRDKLISQTNTNNNRNALKVQNGSSQEDDYTLVERKKRSKHKNNMCGSAPSSAKIVVAEIPAAIYVSRMALSSSEQDLKEYVQEKGEKCIGVQLLKQKYKTSFKSYKIFISKDKLNTFLCNTFWPVGIKYRIYRERYVKPDKVNQSSHNNYE
jgi:hypothetical protein